MKEQFLFILFEWKFYCFLHCFLFIVNVISPDSLNEYGDS